MARFILWTKKKISRPLSAPLLPSPEMAKRLSAKLFVSRLSFHTTNEHLMKLFSPFGEVLEARLVIDSQTQRPKGFGFVTYGSEVEAQKALKAMNGRVVDGRLIFVEVAKTSNPGEESTS